MNSRKSDDLVNKYLAAESSLEEEQQLFNSKTQPPEIKNWASYIEQKRKKSPANLNEKIWDGIQTRKRKKQRYLYTLSAVAASITLLVTFFFFNNIDKPSDYAKKEALLNEALLMFAEEEPNLQKQTILYEDDLVIIYVASN